MDRAMFQFMILLCEHISYKEMILDILLSVFNPNNTQN